MSLYVPPLFPAEVIDKGGQVFNVKAYGAKGDNSTDDTAAIQAAMDAATSGGVVYFPRGTYLVSAALTVSYSVTLLGDGVGVSVIFVKASSVTITSTSFVLITFDGTDVGIDGLTIDGNSTNQTITPSSTTVYYMGAIGSSSANAQSLTVGKVKFQNFFSSNTDLTGIGLDTYGFGTVIIDVLRADATDTGLFITAPTSSSPFSALIGVVDCHNCNSAGVLIEGISGVQIDLAHVYNDANSTSSSIPQDGVLVSTTNATSNIVIGSIRAKYCGYPFNVGNGQSNLLTDSSFSAVVAEDCIGSINIGPVDSSVHFGSLIARGCAINGVGITAFGSVEFNGSASTDYIMVDSVLVVDSKNNGISINSGNGKARIASGSISGSTDNPVNFSATPVGLALHNIVGYNPTGPQTAPAIPTSASAYTNPFPFDCAVYVTGGTVTAVAIGGTATGLTSGQFFVPAGETITLTYSAAPTWTWFGN